MTVSHSNTPRIEQRISYQNFKATVRYIGEVAGANGVWLGVEWDDPSRGKHNGEKDGVQYFQCRYAIRPWVAEEELSSRSFRFIRFPRSGSFIRLSNAVLVGQSFLQAVKEKYIDAGRNSSKKEVVILGSSHGSIEVEAVGLDRVRGKLSHLERLRNISLDGENVAFSDPEGEIKSTCPSEHLALTL